MLRSCYWTTPTRHVTMSGLSTCPVCPLDKVDKVDNDFGGMERVLPKVLPYQKFVHIY